MPPVSRDREVRWHAVNGLVFFGAVPAVALAATIVGILAPSVKCLYAVGMGILALIYLAARMMATHSAVRRSLFDNIAIYWHFIGVLWVYLFSLCRMKL